MGVLLVHVCVSEWMCCIIIFLVLMELLISNSTIFKQPTGFIRSPASCQQNAANSQQSLVADWISWLVVLFRK